MPHPNPPNAESTNIQTPRAHPDAISHDFATDEFYTASVEHPLAQFGTIRQTNDIKSPSNIDRPVTLSEYRVLLGISSGPGAKDVHAAPSNTKYPHLLPIWLHRILPQPDREEPTSIYYRILAEEKATMAKAKFYSVVVYGCLIMQLVVSGAIVILGALPGHRNIEVSVLGAWNGLLTGILGIIKGSGMPIRLIKYQEGLRKVRDKIEWYERQLRAELMTVTLRMVFKLRADYELAREMQIDNNPDVWKAKEAPAETSVEVHVQPPVGKAPA